jgi:L-ascorbate metabolism protein UlaG (beta-lactamase superfamily)
MLAVPYKLQKFATAFAALLAALLGAAVAHASCAPVASLPVWRASTLLAEIPAGHVGIRFLGHASFVIESPKGVRAVTDYNGYLRPESVPDIVTMNHAHPSHYTDAPDPAIKHVLRGWAEGGKIPQYDLTVADVHVFNVPTNIRDWNGGTEYAGNSIFVFEVGDLCIAHLGHLHHLLTKEHLAQLGPIDVVLAPVDGTWTLDVEGMIEVIEAIHPELVIPMHYFTEATLSRFVAKLGDRWPVHVSEVPSTVLSRPELPRRTEVLVLPGGG